MRQQRVEVIPATTIDMMSGDSYYMKYRSSQEYEGEKVDAILELGVNGVESFSEGIPVQMEILEMSKDIPTGMFDIPDGYEVMEY